MPTRIMYIEDRSGRSKPGRIGCVKVSADGKTVTYQNRKFVADEAGGFNANFRDVASGAPYWISTPRHSGVDGLFGRITQPEDVDPEAAEKYWRDIRGNGRVRAG